MALKSPTALWQRTVAYFFLFLAAAFEQAGSERFEFSRELRSPLRQLAEEETIHILKGSKSASSCLEIEFA